MISILFIISIIGCVNCKCNLAASSTAAECALEGFQAGQWFSLFKCFRQLWYDCREEDDTKTNSAAGDGEYDITINSEWDYLRQLGQEGWSVKLRKGIREKCNKEKDKREECFRRETTINGCYVAWTGGFNKGKTTMLNKVSDRNFATGYDEQGETKGFNFILPQGEDDEEIVHIDTPGATRSVNPVKLHDRFMTDKFVFDVLPDLVDMIVVVVDILTSAEQIFIFDEVLEKAISYSTQFNRKSVFIVHNFKTLLDIKTVNQSIQSDIFQAFNHGEKPKAIIKKCRGYDETPKACENGTKKTVAFYTSKYKQKMIEHFVFAAEGTDAGDYYNPISTFWLKRRIYDQPCDAQSLPLLDRFIEKLEYSLRDYFYEYEPVTSATIIKPAFNLWASLRRTARYTSGGFFYQNTLLPKTYQIITDKSKDPFKCKFETSTTNKDIDGVIVLKEKRELKYCPTNKLGDQPQCKPTTYCYTWSNERQWGLQCMLPDADFSETITNFEEDIQSKLFVLRPNEGCELIIYGTIQAPWREYVDNTDLFKLELTEVKTHGFVERRFEMKQKVCLRYHDHGSVVFKNGVLTVIVALEEGHSEL